MIHCKDCKYWTYTDSTNPRHRICCHIPHPEEIKEYPEKDFTSLATVNDSEGYHAWLCTSPDFGCIAGVQK